ncbi:MAG TPA: cadherin-like domain-containing protein, partial [Pirellulales bacterium]|nr:cadherin-like domain-containing protein [Pirellulales bacterium]
TPVNDSATVNEDATASTATRTAGVLGNDSDPDHGDAANLVVSAIVAGSDTSGSSSVTAGQATVVHGTYGDLSINADGTYSYTPNNANAEALAQGEQAQDVFTYTAKDTSGATATATLTFDITGQNDAPVTGAASASGNEDTAIAVTLSGTDVDGTVDSFKITSLPANGTLYSDAGLTQAISLDDAVSATGNTDTVYFVPAANYNGATSFQYAAIDNTGAQGAAATASITVNAVNDAPVASVPASDYAATAGVDLALQGTGLSVSDVDGGSGVETITLAVGEGILTATAGTSDVSIDSGNGTGSLQVSGTIAQLNNFLAGTSGSTIAYNDNASNPGASTTLTLTIDDNGNTGGGDQSNHADATIDITPAGAPPNQAPVIAGTPSTTINFDSLDASNAQVDGATLANYLAAYGIALSASGTGADPVVADDRTIYGGGIVGATSGHNVFAENGGFPVSYTLTFAHPLTSFAFERVTENSGPSGTAYPQWSATAYDANGNVLSSVGENAHSIFSGTTPASPFTLTGAAIDHVTFTGNDNGFAAFANVLTDDWTIAGGGLYTNEDTPVTFNGISVSDADAGSAQIKVTLAVSHGTLSVNETGLDAASTDNASSIDLYGSQAAIDAALASGITYTPNANYNGGDTLSVGADDQGHTGSGGDQLASQIFDVTVGSVNDAPVLALNNGGSVSATEQVAVALAPALSLSDVDSSTLLSAKVQITGNYAAGEDVLSFADPTGKIQGSWDSGSGTLTLTALAGQTPTDADFQAALRAVTYEDSSNNPSTATRTVTFTVQDPDGTANGGHDTAVATTSVAITPVDNPPVLNSFNLPIVQGGNHIVSTGDIAFTDPDSPNSDISFVASNVSGGTFQFNNAGTWTNTTTFAYNDIVAGNVRFHQDGTGTAPSFSIAASDGTDNSAAISPNVDFLSFSVAGGGPPVEGQQLQAFASFTGADAAVTNVSYQWQESSDNGATWQDISSAAVDAGKTNAGVPLSLYQMTEADEGRIIRVTASYTDANGVARTLTDTSQPVADVAPIITPPFTYKADELTISKNGSTIYDNTFAQAPPYSTAINGNPVGFATLGSTWTAVNNQAILSSTGAVASNIPNVDVVLARLTTNDDPNSTSGLKLGAAFDVSAKFDLTVPPTGSYGIELNDGIGSHPADQIEQILLQRQSNGNVAVILEQVNNTGNVSQVTPVASQVLTANQLTGNDQIVFDLAHAANSTALTGSFSLLSGGTTTY